MRWATGFDREYRKVRRDPFELGEWGVAFDREMRPRTRRDAQVFAKDRRTP
ncbi:hypothetical protein [Nocardia concava]|uniref:hypothetical protein n=1 Tax=Nocardia concava TaxID=257281 RepID=UPI0012FC3B28|nr:hypothetical protein [Nocardia concava]